MWKTWLLLSFLVSSEVMAQKITREDFMISSDPGVRIFIREISGRKRSRKPPILLIHGGGAGGIALYDLPVAGGSLAGDLAAHGLKVYIVDIRGWEKSTRPDYDTNKRWVIAGSSAEVSRDIDAAVDFIIDRTGQRQVTLFGCATGGNWAGYYSCIYPYKVNALIMLNSLYNVKAPWIFTDRYRNPLDTSQFYYASTPVLRRADAAKLLQIWNNSIPVADKTQWYDPAVVQAYAKTAVSFHEDAVLEVPGGYRAESFYTAQGKGLWHAKDITVPILVVRGALDTWSRPEDMKALEEKLVNAPKKQFLTLPEGTHIVFLDKPEKGRAQLIDAILSFNQKRPKQQK